MFGLFKRRKPVTMELDRATIEAMFDEVDSPEEREYERISEHVSGVLDTLKVDVKQRRFICKDGSALSIAELTQRIHENQSTLPIDDIDLCITDWLEDVYCPEGISVKQMNKLQIKIQHWIKSHQCKQETV